MLSTQQHGLTHAAWLPGFYPGWPSAWLPRRQHPAQPWLPQPFHRQLTAQAVWLQHSRQEACCRRMQQRLG